MKLGEITPFYAVQEYQSWCNPLQSSVAFHIETSHLICIANQMTVFYIKCSTRLKWFNYAFSLSFLYRKLRRNHKIRWEKLNRQSDEILNLK